MKPIYRLPKKQRAAQRAKVMADKQHEKEVQQEQLAEMFSPFRPRVAVLVLNEDMIANKTVALPNAPTDPNSVLLIPVGGIPQVYGLDYIVSGETLTWKQMGLDNFLEPNDILILHY